jgi:hypothetical protein
MILSLSTAAGALGLLRHRLALLLHPPLGVLPNAPRLGGLPVAVGGALEP